LRIEAVATPGHTANHMAYAFKKKTCCSPAIM
jgi:glyoxylase-like metal-dependent hydrolase (beta-lactamase superfamily II)